MAVPGGAPANVAVQAAGQAAVQVAQPDPEPITSVDTLQDVVAVLEQNSEMLLASQVYQFVHLVTMKKGRLDIRIDAEAPSNLSQNLSQALKQSTGERWMVTVSGEPGAPTLAEKAAAAEQKRFEEVLQDPLVKSVLEIFPDAELKAIHDQKDKT